MEWDHISNCKECGRLFKRVAKDDIHCASCTMQFSQDHVAAQHFLNRHGQSDVTVKEMSQETGISEKRIVQMMKMGKLDIEHFPNLTYKCEMCNEAEIQTGKLCMMCRSDLKTDYDNLLSTGKYLEDERCKECGRMLKIGEVAVCTTCSKLSRNEYQVCQEFLNNPANKYADVKDMSRVTGIPEKRLIEFMQRSKISVKNHPNLYYPCGMCGTPIQKDRLCDPCKFKLKMAVNEM